MSSKGKDCFQDKHPTRLCFVQLLFTLCTYCQVVIEQESEIRSFVNNSTAYARGHNNIAFTTKVENDKTFLFRVVAYT